MKKITKILFVISVVILQLGFNVPSHGTKFAVIGDYGENCNASTRVAKLVKSWEPEFIVTVGDKNYQTENLQDNDKVCNKEESPSDMNEKKAIFEKRYHDRSGEDTEENFYKSIERKVFFELVQSEEIENA